MEWTRGPVIGRGSSASVSLATTASGDLFAVKSTELSSSTLLQREQNFLSQLSSPRVVKYLGYDIKYEHRMPTYNIFMEYLPGGTLSDVIKKQGGSLDESMIRVYTNQILQGLDYLHLNNLVHCDIKGQNILLGKDGVKIADLGCAKLVENGVAATSAFSGTPVFMAPEVARGEEQGFPADIWALGCTIIEMGTGSNPWPELDDPVSALHKIGYSGEVPEFPKWLSEDAKDFLSKCLERDAKERWTAKELLEHQFLDELESDCEKVEEFIRNSPTGVLDLCFWDSLEVSDQSSQNPNYSSNSPAAAERIRGLVSSAGPILPNWAHGEDWFTVRINDIEETAQVSEPNGDINSDGRPSIHRDFFDFSVVNEEDLESSEDLLLECPVENIISTHNNIRIRIDPVLSSVTEIIWITINVEKQVNKTISPLSINFFHRMLLVHFILFTTLAELRLVYV